MLSVKEIKRKICLIGDWGVGKTSLIRKFVLDQYDDIYLATFGTKTTKKRIKFKKDENHIIDLTLMIWDIMGQKEFNKIQSHAYRGAQAAFIVCDITRKQTLFDVCFWKMELFNIARDIPIIVLANKFDLRDDAEITSEDLKEISSELQVQYFLTSAKTGKNVEMAFVEIGKLLVSDYI